MKHMISNEPVWEFEAVCAIATNFQNLENKIMENHEKYGFTKEEMSDFLEKFILYKKTVLSEAMPIFNKKFDRLEPYFLFDPDDSNNPIIVHFLERFSNIFNENITNEEIDDMIAKTIDRILYDSLGDYGSNCDFSNISDIILFLNKTQLSDKTKMNIINFYMDRYNLSRMIVDLIIEIAPICRKYFYIVEEEYKKNYDNIMNTDTLEKFVKRYTNLDIDAIEDIELHINIFLLSQLSVNLKNLYNVENNIFVGFKIIALLEHKNNNKYTDTQLVAGFKSIADTTRYKIINMLSERTMYMQEIADELGLTAANVSHHISMLFQNDIITTVFDSKENKKIYYELNKSEIVNLSEALLRITKK